LAQSVGLSRRQLERLFRQHIGRSPTQYYLELRLQRARLLLIQTDLPVVDVAVACGFVSASHFSKSYRQQFDRAPRDERRHMAEPAVVVQ
jgi:transcriptional regulator GlxA family with amidase domain